MPHFKIPLCNAIKFVPLLDKNSTYSPGIHMDDEIAMKQLKSFEIKSSIYRQKWNKYDETTIQIQCSDAPDDLKILNSAGHVVQTVAWTNTLISGVGFTYWEVPVNLSGLTMNQMYFVYIRVANIAQAISEPIYLKTLWPETKQFQYSHKYNDYDVQWLTGIKMNFRCEAHILDFNPERERTALVNTNRDVVTLYGLPYRSYKLNIGNALGVPWWVMDLMNRIFVCSYISITGDAILGPNSDFKGQPRKQYQSSADAKWEIKRVNGYPFIGGVLEITEAFANNSLEFASADGHEEGGSKVGSVVSAYNIETNFFGPGSLVPITDITEE